MSNKIKTRKKGFSMPMAGVQLTPEAEFQGQLIRYAQRSLSLPPVPGWSGPIPMAARPVLRPLNDGVPFLPPMIGSANGTGIEFANFSGAEQGGLGGEQNKSLPVSRPMGDKLKSGCFLSNKELPQGSAGDAQDPVRDAISGIAAAIPGQLAMSWASRATSNAMLAAVPGGPMSTILQGLGLPDRLTKGPLSNALEAAVQGVGGKPAMSLLPGVADIIDGGSPQKLASAIGTQGALALLDQTNLKDIPGGELVANAIANRVGGLIDTDDPLGGLASLGGLDSSVLEDLGQQVASGLVSPQAISQLLDAAGIKDLPGAGPVAKALGKELQEAMKDGLGGLTDIDLSELADSLGDALLSPKTMNQLLAEAGLDDIPGIGAVSDALSDELKSLLDGKELGASFDLDDFAANAFDKAADQLLDMWEVDDNSSALEHIANKLVKDNFETLKDAATGLATDADAYLTDLQAKFDQFFKGHEPGTGQPCAHLGSKDNLSDALIEGFPQVLVGELAVSRVGDKLAPSMKKVLVGSPTVLTGGLHTAYVGSDTEIPSKILLGNATVLIGIPKGTGGSGKSGSGGSAGTGPAPKSPEAPTAAAGASSQTPAKAEGETSSANGDPGVAGDNAVKNIAPPAESPTPASPSSVNQGAVEPSTTEPTETESQTPEELAELANPESEPETDTDTDTDTVTEELASTSESESPKQDEEKSDLETLGEHLYDDTVGTVKGALGVIKFTGEQLGEMAKDPGKAIEDIKRGAGVLSDIATETISEAKADFDRGLNKIYTDPIGSAQTLGTLAKDKINQGIDYATDKPLTTTYEAAKIAVGVGAVKKVVKESGELATDSIKKQLKSNNSTDDLITVYRGDKSDSKVIKSYSAREKGYSGSQQTIDEGDLDELMFNHAEDSRKAVSPFISTSTDRKVAEHFAGKNGVVHEMRIPKDRAIPNPHNNKYIKHRETGELLSEQEYLVPNYVRPSEIKSTKKLE